PSRFLAVPPPMLSVPASSHFVAQYLLIEGQKLRDSGAVRAEKDQLAALPVPPSRAINTKLSSSLTGRPTVPTAQLESTFANGCRPERVVVEKGQDSGNRSNRRVK